MKAQMERERRDAKYPLEKRTLQIILSSELMERLDESVPETEQANFVIGQIEAGLARLAKVSLLANRR